MSAAYETHRFEWDGITIEVRYNPDWSQAYRDVYGYLKIVPLRGMGGDAARHTAKAIRDEILNHTYVVSVWLWPRLTATEQYSMATARRCA
jgi:hypothetical protein